MRTARWGSEHAGLVLLLMAAIMLAGIAGWSFGTWLSVRQAAMAQAPVPVPAPSRPATEGYTPIPDRAAPDQAADEVEHARAGAMSIDRHCRKMWGRIPTAYQACLAAEEAARFDLTAMCGTEELMEMWRRCAADNPSLVAQRYCMNQELELRSARIAEMRAAGLELVATASYTPRRGMYLTPHMGAALNTLEHSVFVVVAGDTVPYVGASSRPLGDTLTRWRQVVNTGLSGSRALGEGFDFSAWSEVLLEHGVLEIYARPGEVVETKAGMFNAFEAEAEHLANVFGARIETITE